MITPVVLADTLARLLSRVTPLEAGTGTQHADHNQGHTDRPSETQLAWSFPGLSLLGQASFVATFTSHNATMPPNAR
ncbi:MAG: hypothetical protein M3O70_14865 [Actinomycetota bacterium]|nr:hypothetical protein [Actinomycetota bacterium]